MQLILVVAGAVGLIVGSLALAALLCSFLWSAFRLMLHPDGPHWRSASSSVLR